MDTKKYLTDKRYVIAIAVFCSILWGSAFPVLKISYEKLNIAAEDMGAKIVFAGMRFFLASVILFIILILFMKHSVKVNKHQISKLLLLGLLQTTFQYFFFYNGMAFTSGMKGSILNSIGNFFTVILAHLIYKDDGINRGKIIGLITGFGGIILANWGQSFSLEFSFRGEGFLIISAIFGAFATIVAKEISKGVHPFVVTAWQMLMGSILLFIFGLPGFKENSITFSNVGWALLIYQAFLSAVAFALWYSILKYNKAGEISLYKFIIPVSGSILSVLLIPQEKFTFYIFSALILVVLGIISLNYTPYISRRK